MNVSLLINKEEVDSVVNVPANPDTSPKLDKSDNVSEGGSSNSENSSTTEVSKNDTVTTESNSGKIKPLKKFVCEEKNCGKSFSTSGHLSRHSVVHSGLKPFQCTIPGCTSRFSRHDNMLQHCRSHARKLNLAQNSYILQQQPPQQRPIYPMQQNVPQQLLPPQYLAPNNQYGYPQQTLPPPPNVVGNVVHSAYHPITPVFDRLPGINSLQQDYQFSAQPNPMIPMRPPYTYHGQIPMSEQVTQQHPLIMQQQPQSSNSNQSRTPPNTPPVLNLTSPEYPQQSQQQKIGNDNGSINFRIPSVDMITEMARNVGNENRYK